MGCRVRAWLYRKNMINPDAAALLELEASAYAAAAAHLRGSFRDTALVLHGTFDGARGELAVRAILDVCEGELNKVAVDRGCETSVLMALLLSASRSLGSGGEGLAGEEALSRTLGVLASELRGSVFGSVELAEMSADEVGDFVASGVATLANVIALRAQLEEVDAAELAQAECLARTGPLSSTS